MSSAVLQAEDQNRSKQSISTLIPRHLLFGNPEKISPQLSPDGKWLAYLAPDENNVLNVWLRDLHQTMPDRKITSDQKRGIRHFDWQFDNRHILYVQDQDGDENWHLYQTNLETSATKDLTPYEDVTVGIVEYDYRHPKEILVQMNLRDKSLFDVYRINLETGTNILDTVNPDAVIQWVADQQLQVRAAQSFTKEGETLIRVRDNPSSPWRVLLTADPDDTISLVGFSSDNRSLCLVSSVDYDTCHLVKIDLTTEKQETLAYDPQYDLSEAMRHPKTDEFEAVGVEKERFEWIVIDSKLEKDFNFLRQQDKGIFKIVSRDLEDLRWIVAYISDQRPAHYYVYDRVSQKLQFLFSTQPALEKYSLSAMTPISFKAKDGMTIHGYLTLPQGKEPRDLPAVLFVHGGPWARDSWGLQSSVQWLANRGYAVLQINFRGSTGYGKKYLNAGNREWAGKMHQDLIDGKQWLINQGYVNPDKIAIYGGSYGGYATLVALTFTPDEFCCGVDVVGPSNISTLLKTMPPYWAPLKVQMDRRVGKLETEEDFLHSRSPLFKANEIRKPLLIAQGANDPRVKQAESDQIVAAMRKHLLPVEYLLFKDEGHGFARPENRLKFFAAAEQFLSKYLGGQVQPPSDEESWEVLRQ